jgi:hypothetical protein
MNESLSPDDVSSLFHYVSNGQFLRVINYDEIITCKSLDSLFDEQPYFVIFYPAVSTETVTMGHFTCIIKNEDMKTIFYFDPLGYKPDEYKQFAHDRQALYQERQNSLIKLLLQEYQDNYNVDWNSHQIQSRRPEVATCGRWCVLRCAFNELSNKDFIKLMSKLSNMLNIDTNSKLKDNLIMYLTE